MKIKNIIVGTVIVAIGVGASYMSLLKFYKFYTYIPSKKPVYTSADKKLSPTTRNRDTGRVPVVAPRRERKKAEVAPTLPPIEKEKVALVAEPVKEKPLLRNKLIAYLDVEKILGWAANIITIVTGVLIILRKRKED